MTSRYEKRRADTLSRYGASQDSGACVPVSPPVPLLPSEPVTKCSEQGAHAPLGLHAPLAGPTTPPQRICFCSNRREQHAEVFHWVCVCVCGQVTIISQGPIRRRSPRQTMTTKPTRFGQRGCDGAHPRHRGPWPTPASHTSAHRPAKPRLVCQCPARPTGPRRPPGGHDRALAQDGLLAASLPLPFPSSPRLDNQHFQCNTPRATQHWSGAGQILDCV